MDITAVKTVLCWVKCSGTRLKGWCRWRLFALWRPEMWIVTCTSCRLIPVWLVKTMKFFFCFFVFCFFFGGVGVGVGISAELIFERKKLGNSWKWWPLSRVWSPWRCFFAGILRDAVVTWSHIYFHPTLSISGMDDCFEHPDWGVSQEGADLEDSPSPGLM